MPNQFPAEQGLSTAITHVARTVLARAILVQAYVRAPGRGTQLAVGAAEVARLLIDANQDAANVAAEDLATHEQAASEALAEFVAWIPTHSARLHQLRINAGLTDDDLLILALLLAPEFDPEFERGYSFVMDDFTRKRPDLRLLAQLICTDGDKARARIRDRLAWNAPLRAFKLVVVGGDEQAPTSQRTVRVADRLLAHLQGDDRLDERVATACVITSPAPLLASLVLEPTVVAALQRLLDEEPPTRLLLVGKAGTGRASAVEAIAAARGQVAIRVDLSALGEPAVMVERLGLALREIVLRNAVAILEGDDLVGELPRAALQVVVQLCESVRTPVVMIWPDRAASLSAAVRDLVELECKPPGFALRIELWRRQLPASASPSDIEALASRYSFGAAAIVQASRRALQAARVRDPLNPVILLDDLGDAARLQFGNRLGSVAQRIPTGFSWSDLVLPADTATAVREFITFARRRAFLLEEWGFAQKLPYGRGVSAILAGPPGTGKTMVAQLLAKELGYDLYRIDLSQVVNKYIGETEKNLARIFDEAETSHAVLFFDEADSLFAKRTEVKSSNDRYANLEVNYLLQRMETFDGVTLLATNLEQGLDEAFKRRVRFSIQFEVPEAEERRRLWVSMFPPQTPLAPDINWDLLGRMFEMAGGYIKKAALRAAMIAADAEPKRAITTADLLEAGRFEYREMGRIVAG